MFHANRQTDTTKLLFNFRNYANVPRVAGFYLPRFKEGITSDTQAVSENTK